MDIGQNRDKNLAYHAETTDQVACLVNGGPLEKTFRRTASATGSERVKRIVVSAIVTKTKTETGIVIVIVGM